jgi:diguanylate cyclase (GGDEF)-like protein
MLGVVCICVLALFYLGVYRPTQSPFSGWWSVSLLCAAVTPVLLLSDGSSLQVFLNPLSSATSAVGTICVWFATRSLRQRSNPVWLMITATAAVVVFAVLDSPATNEWAGNGPLFLVMAAAFMGAAAEVWATWAQRRAEPDARESSEAITALLVCSLAATLLAIMYTARFLLFVVLGHDSELFTRLVGSAPTSITLLLCLVAVTFSVSGIGWDQRTRDLRRRAVEDDLTGLLGRSSFLARAQDAIAQAGGRRSRQSWLVIADIDNFKPINDEFGHQAGDRTLRFFADVAKGALRSSDAIGRLGGDEFGFVLENVEQDAVLARLADIRRVLAEDDSGRVLPTVSFGVAECHAGLTLSEVLGRADAALYEAKDAGRNRASVYTADPSSA